MSDRAREIVLRIVAFLSLFIHMGAVLTLVAGIEGSMPPQYRVIVILVGIVLALVGPITTGLLLVRLGERTRTVVVNAILGMVFPLLFAICAIQPDRPTKLLRAQRRADDAAERGRKVQDADIDALGELGDITRSGHGRAMELLVRCARQNRDPRIRTSAIYWISDVKAPGILGALTGALQDKDSRVRTAAANALGHWQDAPAVASLEQALQDKDGGVRQSAEAALAKLKSSSKPSTASLVKEFEGLFMQYNLEAAEQRLSAGRPLSADEISQASANRAAADLVKKYELSAPEAAQIVELYVQSQAGSAKEGMS